MSTLSSKNILVIQTAFIGDTILASQFAYQLSQEFPGASIHFFLRKGNESVIENLPFITKTWIWDKKGGKTKNLLRLIKELRNIRFDFVFNLHRHFNSGLVTASMKGDQKLGFKQNPLSFFFDKKVNHEIPHIGASGKSWHEVQRNLLLLKAAKPGFEISEEAKNYRPHLPVSEKNREKVAPYTSCGEYFVVAPASVWFTKAWSEHKFRELTTALNAKGKVFLIGGPDDHALCERIGKDLTNVENLCGKLSLLDSGALMEKAKRVFVNDSGPLHLASCMNAKTTAIFCSTVPEFGYTPLAEDSVVIDMGKMDCRPCGLHGHTACPLGHYKCSEDIEVSRVLATIN
ncbi:MAG TPA: glycosyltransferase family 9 protein [Bacteriovoracaceae bacterium]|nr:glycosyltransferase family 9 protein [Bacteriovoracaceae bacterium]